MADDLVQVLRTLATDLGLTTLLDRLGGLQHPDDAEAAAALRGVWLVELERRDDTVRLVLEREGFSAFALARPWLTTAAGAVYPAAAVLRLTGPDWVREQYTFTAPAAAADLRLHLSAGSGRPGIDLPLPAAGTSRRRAA